MSIMDNNAIQTNQSPNLSTPVELSKPSFESNLLEKKDTVDPVNQPGVLPRVGAMKAGLPKDPLELKPKKKINTTPYIFAFVILALISIGSFFGYQAYNSSRISDYEAALTEAQQYYLKREYAEALRSINDAVAVYPNRSTSYRLAIKILIDKNQLSKAAEVATSADSILNKTEESQVWGDIGVTYFNMADYKNAVKALKLSNDAKSGTSYTNYYVKALLLEGDLALAKKLISKTDEASIQEAWDRYEGINSETTLYDVTKTAHFLLNTGYPTLTIELLKSRTDIDEYWEAQYYLGRAYFEIADYTNAKTYLQNAVTLGSLDSGVVTYLARADYRLDQVNDSIKNYDKALSLFEDETSRYLVAREFLNILIDEGLYTKAGILLGTYSDAENSDWQMLYLKYYIATDDPTKVSSTVEYLLGLKLDDKWEYWRELNVATAKYYIEEGMLAEATEIVGLLKASNSFDAYVPLFEAQILVKKGEDGAIELCNRAMELDLNGEVTLQAKDLISTVEAAAN